MKPFLDELYRKYNRNEYIDPDPLLFVRRFSSSVDREAAAFIAANFALGRVHSILGFLDGIFTCFPSPRKDLVSGEGLKRWEQTGPHYYRFYKKDEIGAFFLETARILNDFGSLEALFLEGYQSGFSILDGLSALVEPFRRKGIRITADPEGQSACKRLHLFLRWMVRRDDVDPGGWEHVNPAHLLYPVDTHILQTAGGLGITGRRQADRRAAEEITGYFRGVSPGDPVKYDFCLSRFGINPGLDYNMLYSSKEEHNRSA